MARSAAMMAAAATLLLYMCVLAAAEESDGTARIPVNIAGLDTTHDVTEHAFIDKDVKDIENAMNQKTTAGYTEALNIYNNGKNSKMLSAMRTLASFWPGLHQNSLGLSSQDEPFLKMFENYEKATAPAGPDAPLGSPGIDPHDSVLAALAGEDHSGRLGKYGSGSDIVGSHAFRAQVIKKNIKFQIIMLYALHELEIAVAAYTKAQENGDGPSDDAQRYVDVWWAFYAGSMETGNGQGSSSYVLAERRAKFFGTDKVEIGNGGKSKVNEILMKATNEIKRLMRANGNTEVLQKLMKCVRAQLKVPLIQGCIQYGKNCFKCYKTDPSTAFDPGNSFTTETGYNSELARKGELWSFCSGVLPFLHAVDAGAATKLLNLVDVDQEVIWKTGEVPSWDGIKAVFSNTNLNKMGVKCSDVGGFVDQDAGKTSATTRNSDFAECTDGTLTNPDADSGECNGSWMEKPASTGGKSLAEETSESLGAESDSQSQSSSTTFSTSTLFAGIVVAGLLKR